MGEGISSRLAYVGPLNEYGFPRWYEDENGTRLELAIGNDPLTPAGEQPPDPGAPLGIPKNFPEEAFYFYAESEMAAGGGADVGRARLILAVEAAFGGAGAPADGTRVVFSRIRVRIDDVIPGAEYTITHPYGVTGPLRADDRGRVFWTDDRGIAEERFDTILLSGQVAPFLRVTDGAPVGYLGDGVTETTITGSPVGTDFFRIDGPSVAAAGGPRDPRDPSNPNRIQSDRFLVQGRLARVSGVGVTRATYARDAAGAVTLDVFGTAVEGQTLELTSPRVAMTTRGRDYVARASTTEVPSEVTLVNVSDEPATRGMAEVTDLVIVTQAEFDQVAGTLTVDATSSDEGGVKLTVVGFGDLTGSPTTFDAAAAPAEVVVTSSAKGRGTRPVVLTSPPGQTLPLVANAGTDITTPAGIAVQLDGTGSRGGITGYAWSQTSGDPVVLDDAAAQRPAFTPEQAGVRVFDLTVTGDGGTASDSVSVEVTGALPPDRLVIDRTQYRTSRRQWRVGGTIAVNGAPRPGRVRVTFGGAELGSSPVDATGAWDVRRTLLDGETHLVPGVGDVVRATSEHGGSAEAAVNVRN